MADVKHTQGPWYVEEQLYKSSSYYIRGSDKNGQRLTWGSGAVAHIPRSTVRPSLANARLIAAAPDLLEALKYARRFLRPADHDTAFIDAAIAKATGAARATEGSV